MPGLWPTTKALPTATAATTTALRKFPARSICAYYDLGGEGVAYHDTDAKNNGSGALNPANGTYLNEFRMAEGVDTSYTKFNQSTQIDDNPYDKVTPAPNMLYVGWTEPGEWFNISVDAAEAGDYSADVLYTSNRGGTIQLDVNGEPATGPLDAHYDLRCKRPNRLASMAPLESCAPSCPRPSLRRSQHSHHPHRHERTDELRMV